MTSGNSSTVKIGVIIVSFTIIMMALLQLPTGISSAEENSDLLEAPNWHEGDKWVYEAVFGTGEDERQEFTERIEATDVPIDPDFPGEDVSYDETYHLVREGENKLNRYYDKDSLSMVFEDGEGSTASFYHPPRRQFNFPFEVGDQWNQTTDEYVGSLDDAADFEHETTFRFAGTVENYTTVKVKNAEYDAYKLNVTIINREGEDELSWGRIEYYYSPEVKNTVKTVMHELRLDPRTDQPDERITGVELLLNYELQEGNDDQDGELPFLGTGLIALIAVGTAYFYKVRKPDSKE